MLLLPLAHRRGDKLRPMADDVAVRKGDEVIFVLERERRAESIAWLGQRGWQMHTGAPEADADAL